MGGKRAAGWLAALMAAFSNEREVRR